MPPPLDDAIGLTISGSIATVTFNRPAARNSLSSELLQRLDLLLSDLLRNSNLHCIIFTGSEAVFLSGADITELAKLDHTAANEFCERGQQLFQRVADARPTTIAAINGYCLGGGLDFALACDLRIASTAAVFAHPSARLGIVTGWGGTQRLPRLIGKARALELFVTARRIKSTEALQWGLISEIHDPVIDGALSLGRRLITKPS